MKHKNNEWIKTHFESIVFIWVYFKCNIYSVLSKINNSISNIYFLGILKAKATSNLYKAYLYY